MKVREFFRCDRCKEEGFGELECSYIRIRDTQTLKKSFPGFCPGGVQPPEWEKLSECQIGIADDDKEKPQQDTQ